MESKYRSLVQTSKTLFFPSTDTKANPFKFVRALRALIISMGLIACITISGCGQNGPSSNSLESTLAPLTKPQDTASEPVVEIEKISPTQIPGPTSIVTPTRGPSPTQLPHTSSTVQPTSTPVSTPTVMPTTAIVPIPTINPATATVLTLNVMPTPTRPKVSGYLLKINGTYVRPNRVSFAIDNGYIMVHPMTGEDGSYPTRTEVILGYYPNNAAGSVSWSGVDADKGPIAEVFMNKDREVIVTIGP